MELLILLKAAKKAACYFDGKQKQTKLHAEIIMLTRPFLPFLQNYNRLKPLLKSGIRYEPVTQYLGFSFVYNFQGTFYLKNNY